MIGFTALMATAMASATVIANSVGVLATELIDEFGLSRAQIGALVTSFGLFATVVSIPTGRVTDRRGGRWALTAAFVSTFVALAILVAAPSYVFLLVALALGGFANASVNPGTNQIIAEHVPEGQRGLVTGVKMSGVQVAVVALGIGLPAGFATLGWRMTMALVGVLPLIGIVWLRQMMPRVVAQPRAGASGPLPAGVKVLAVYTFLMSAAAFAVVTYIPLFAEERLGMSAKQGGLAVAVSGLVAIAGRLVWGAATERMSNPATALTWLGIGSAAGAVGMAVAARVGPGSLWPLAVVIGATAISFNAAATMAMLRATPVHAIGRASGVVFGGFLAGIAVGPVAFGAIVDAHSYPVAWWTAGAVFLAAVATSWGPVRRTHNVPGV
jgi:predicted MFS family arabinose efflux permease